MKEKDPSACGVIATDSQSTDALSPPFFTCSSALDESKPSSTAVTSRLSPMRILVSPGATAIDLSGNISLTNHPIQSCFILARQSSGRAVNNQPASASMPKLANTGPMTSEAGRIFLIGAFEAAFDASLASKPTNGELTLRRFISR